MTSNLHQSQVRYLSILAASLATQRDVTVGVISRPQANIADFYREMGELFGVELRPHIASPARKSCDSAGRPTSRAHCPGRPVLVVDEAQEMQSSVLAELRLLTSADPRELQYPADRGARRRRTARRTPALRGVPPARQPRAGAPADRTRIAAGPAGVPAATPCTGPSAPTLMTAEVIAAICDHAQGNPRALMIMAAELLEAAAQREARQIDETLFFEICAVPATSEAKAATRRRR